MFLISFEFAGRPQQSFSVANNIEELMTYFEKLKFALEKDYGKKFNIQRSGDTHVLSGNDHDGYQVAYVAHPVKNVKDLMV
jgi:hypothetical protein